jgi:hypothetical protein
MIYPTLAHFRHSLRYPLYAKRSTFVENVRQITLFLQNEPNFMCFSPKNKDITKKRTQFEPNLKPNEPNKAKNKPNSKPIQSQFPKGQKMQKFMKIFKYFSEFYCIILHIMSYYYIYMKGFHYAINVNR